MSGAGAQPYKLCAAPSPYRLAESARADRRAREDYRRDERGVARASQMIRQGDKAWRQGKDNG